MSTSLTSDDTILPNAPPIMTPIAISSTLPLIANSLNSFSMMFLLKGRVGAMLYPLSLTCGVETITQREQIQEVGVGRHGRRPIVVARGHLKAAGQPATIVEYIPLNGQT